jgi:hypothetical protein
MSRAECNDAKQQLVCITKKVLIKREEKAIVQKEILMVGLLEHRPRSPLARMSVHVAPFEASNLSHCTTAVVFHRATLLATLPRGGEDPSLQSQSALCCTLSSSF